MKERMFYVVDGDLNEVNNKLDNGWRIKQIESAAAGEGCSGKLHSFAYICLVNENE